MKLLCFFVLLLAWRVPMIRGWLRRIPVLPSYVNYLDKLLSQRQWYSQNSGLLLVVLSFAFIVDLIALICGYGLIGFVFQSAVLLLAIYHLNDIEFVASHVNFLSQSPDQAKLNELPDSVWKTNYYFVAPLFWYVLFGTLGLSLYWMLAYLQQHSRWQTTARTWLEIFAWVPARVLAFAYSVAGNFSQGLKIIAEFFGAGVQYNQSLLQCCALASMMQKDEIGLQANMQRLVRDALVLLVGLYALFAVLNWLII